MTHAGRLRALLLLCACAALGCGQTSRDRPVGEDGGSIVECAGAHWTRLAPPAGATTVRLSHAAVAWQSDQIIIWGGDSFDPSGSAGAGRLDTGWRVFSDGRSMALPREGAPSRRDSFAFGVVGNRFLVWGGSSGSSTLSDGAWLDLEADSWSPLPSPGSFLGKRSDPLAGAAGTRWLVWGGANNEEGVFASGALYDPTGDTWLALAKDAPAALSNYGVALVQAPPDIGPAVFGGGTSSPTTNLGYGFEPTTGGWWLMPAEGAPSPRSGASLAWSTETDELIVWGGYGPSDLGDGARLSLLTGAWRPMSSAGAPSARSGHHAVVLGGKLVVFGGYLELEHTSTGGVYDLLTDTWEPLPLDECAPEPRNDETFTAFGNGERALLWGGYATEGTGWASTQDPEHGWLFSL